MAVNKVNLNGETLIDLTSDTVTPEDVAVGKTFHLANGEKTMGTNTGGSSFTGGYTVTFFANGSVFAQSSVLEGGSVVAPQQKPTPPSGYAFTGWSLSQSGTPISFPFTPTSDTSIYAVMKTQTIIGFTGLTGQTGNLTWTDDIASLQSSPAYSTTTSGRYVNVTGALENFFPFNQLQDVTDDNGNVFVRFPQLWMKWVTDSNGNIDGIQISNVQAGDDFFLSDAFLNPNEDYTYLDSFLMGKYEASGSSSKAYSKSGAACLVALKRSAMRTACRSYGNSGNYYNGYQQLDIQMLTLYNFLCMMFYRTANIQTVFGGRTGAVEGTSWNNAAETGATDGLNGMNGWDMTTNCVKMLGVENPYGNAAKWCDGVLFSSGTIYIYRFPPLYRENLSYGINAGFSRPTSDGWIKSLKAGQTDETRSAVYCVALGGSSVNYVGDYCDYSTSGTVLVVGGYWDGIANAGLWCLNGDISANSAYAYCGGRLCKRPI